VDESAPGQAAVPPNWAWTSPISGEEAAVCAEHSPLPPARWWSWSGGRAVLLFPILLGFPFPVEFPAWPV